MTCLILRFRSPYLAARGRPEVDRRPRPDPPPSLRPDRQVLDERQGPVSDDDGNVLPEGPPRGQDALQGLSDQALHGHVQQFAGKLRRRESMTEEEK